MINLFKKLKRVKMTDYDLGILDCSEGRQPRSNSNLYMLGYSIGQKLYANRNGQNG